MKIRGKLLTGYLVVAVLTAAVGWFGMGTVISKELEHQAEQELPLRQLLQTIKYAGLRVVSSSTEYGFLYRRGNKVRLVKELEEEQQLIANGVKTYCEAMERYGLLSRKHKRGAVDGAVEEIRKAGDGMIRASIALVNAVQTDAPADELMELKETSENAERRFIEIIEQQSKKDDAHFTQSKMFTYETIRGARHNILLLTGATFALALLSGFVISGSISRRLNILQQAVHRMGEGELQTSIEIGSKDEIGALASSFTTMAQALARSTQEIIAGKDYFSEVIHSMMDALIIIGPDGMIQQVNGAACAMLGYEEEPVGRSFTEVLPDYTQEQLVSLGYLTDEEKVLIACDGRRIPVTLSVSVVWNSDNSVRSLVCVAHDITSRKQWEAMQKRYNQELKDSNEELRGFVYTISHDLRTPLVNIRGFAGELDHSIRKLDRILEEISPQLETKEQARMEDLVKKEVPEALGFINTSVRKMDVMLTSILRLSHLGQRRVSVEPVRVDELIDEVLAGLEDKIAETGAEVTVGNLPVVETDRAALKEIFSILLDNAIAYRSMDRPTRIMVSAERVNEVWLFKVRDNGRGISEEDQAKIFAPFRRVGQQDTNGEGMGLAFVRALVKHCQGTIWCSSAVDAGSTFTFTIGESRIMNEQGGWR